MRTPRALALGVSGKVDSKYEAVVLPIIIEHLGKCRDKEVPQHAERASVCFSEQNAGSFIEVLESRNPLLAPQAQKRVNKLLRQLESIAKN